MRQAPYPLYNGLSFDGLICQAFMNVSSCKVVNAVIKAGIAGSQVTRI
jgi:hypothetical protein